MFPADEVGVVVGDEDVVDGCDFIGRADRFDRNQLAIVADELVTRFELPSRNIERVFGLRRLVLFWRSKFRLNELEVFRIFFAKNLFASAHKFSRKFVTR